VPPDRRLASLHFLGRRPVAGRERGLGGGVAAGRERVERMGDGREGGAEGWWFYVDEI
jgi:hypothetical protein